MSIGKIIRIKEIITLLNQARQKYYNEDTEIMTNKEYDKLFDELKQLEWETGYVQSDSPTINVGSVTVNKLTKVLHSQPMLSLDKTKSVDELKTWLGDKEGIISWKLDGLTVILNYEDEQLKQAVTRGNKTTGEDITHNARVFKNIPLLLNFDKSLELRGEGLISYKDFERINDMVVRLGDEPYANPRNLASGTVRQLNNDICKDRNVNFVAFTLVQAEEMTFKRKSEQYEWLKQQGFDVVPYLLVNKSNIEQVISTMSNMVNEYEYPTDGLVLTYNDIEYSNSLGVTSHHPLDSIAFKWQDDSAETIYRGIIGETSRTGIITPVATFDAVDIEGTTVTKASLHNVDQWELLELGVGDRITVYKANKIIPQIDDNLDKSGTEKLFDKCPDCGGEVEIIRPKDARFLRCTNVECPAKIINRFKHFVSRDCMNIVGLSKETIDKFVEEGFINEFADIYQLDRFEKQIKNMEGFGTRSYHKLMESIDASKSVEMPNFLNALGIKLIGLSGAKDIAKAFDYDMMQLVDKPYNNYSKLLHIEGFGGEKATSVYDYFLGAGNNKAVKDLLQYITIKKPETNTNEKKFENLTFVITGTLSKDRKYFQNLIEQYGGKCSSSVSKKTHYVLYGAEAGSKLDKAKELNVKTINEEQFNELLKG